MEYRKDLDSLKGFAILAVVLFHMGLLKSGYLGVDLFFVLNGFFIIPSLCRAVKGQDFSYFGFIEKRTLRLLPLVVIASFVCLVIGYAGMLPDDFEDVCESIVASNFFSQNILAAITTKDYWNFSNDYRPLMHLWYVGILFEFYLVIPLFALLGKFISKRFKVDFESVLNHIVAILFFLSLIAYLLPVDTEANKFYFLHYRLFELCLGGLLGLNFSKIISSSKEKLPRLQYIPVLLLLFVLFSSLYYFNAPLGTQEIVSVDGKDVLKTYLIQSKPVLLVLTVLLSCVVIGQNNRKIRILNGPILSYLGKRSYSIFVWHQIILAFYRYFVSKSITWTFLLGFVAAVLILSELSYRLVERKVKVSHKNFALWVALALLAVIPSLLIFQHAGVVRDVPEQNIQMNNVHRGMHADYCDRIYGYDRDFPKANGKMNVLVEGNSFARDFANCLFESKYKDSINLSYVPLWEEKSAQRVKAADFVFSLTPKQEIPLYIWNNLKHAARIWGIGTKSFGESNGIIYIHRHSRDYLKSSIELDKNFVASNDQLAEQWGKKYINFIEMAQTGKGRIRVFTPGGKFISQDCMHLTREGAQWYASIIHWDEIFGK